MVGIAQSNGAASDPIIRKRLVDAWIALKLVRLNAVANLASPTPQPSLAAINKYGWATWHREFGALSLDILGPEAEIVGAPYTLWRIQSRSLFARSDTIYGGTNEIQLNVIAEQGLGLPREPRPDGKS